MKIIATLFASIAVVATAYAQNVFPASGNVGIGNDAPGGPLQIKGPFTPALMQVSVQSTPSDDRAGISFWSSGGVRTASFYAGSDGNSYLSGTEITNGVFHIYSAGAERMTFQPSGNIGIGTTTPAEKLELSGGHLLFGNNYGLRFKNNAGATGSYLWHDYVESENRLVMMNADAGGGLHFFAGGGSAGYERLTILSSGNVGIGTTNPWALLSLSALNSSVQLRLERTGNGVGTADIGADDRGLNFWGAGYDGAPDVTIATDGNVGIGTASPQSKLQVGAWNLIKDGTWAPPAGPSSTSAGERIVFYQGGGWKTAIGMDGQNGIWFQAHTPGGQVAYQWFTGAVSSAPTEKMRIMENGNVGIGTTSPSHKLAVNGTVRAKEVIVDTGWADYVFKKGYRLAPLTEVEAHIEREGHLPGIPSATEVAEHGVSMGEMQARLLAKVEELTLHVIAQEKRIQKLETENTALRSASHE